MKLSLLVAGVVGFTMACGGSGDSGSGSSELGARTGVDYSWARPSPSGLAAEGYTFASRYLSSDPTKNISLGEAQALKAAGVDVVVGWEDSATATLGGYARGVADATEAAAEATAAGMPAGRPIYFAIDFDAQPSDQPAIDAYFDGVAAVIGRGRAGAYGGFGVIQRLFNDGKITYGWQTYAWSYGNWDGRAQLRQVQNGITAAGDTNCCDKDVAVAADFGQWGYAGSTTSGIPSPSDYVGIASTTDGKGYWVVKGDGGIFSFGDAAFHGSAGGTKLNMPAVGMATTSDKDGYWIAAADGGLFTYGDAPFLGSMGGTKLAGPVLGIAGTKSGYWMVADDGGVFSFGVPFYGSMGGKHLNSPVCGIAATPSGAGYWLVARDGGVFGFGDAGFYGSMGGTKLNAPVVGMAPTPSGHGYWLVAADGGMFSFGDAHFYGSMGGKPLNAPVTGMAARPQGDGYWLIAKDGGVFTFGAAGFYGRP